MFKNVEKLHVDLYLFKKTYNKLPWSFAEAQAVVFIVHEIHRAEQSWDERLQAERCFLERGSFPKRKNPYEYLFDSPIKTNKSEVSW